MTLRLYSEPYRPQGNIDARASVRTIRTVPHLDHWSLFLRETLQNSWDARLAEAGGVGFSVDAFWLSPEQEEFLRDEVFAELPQGGSELAEWLENDVSLLVVTDRGCRGLGGPTRADISIEGSSDFVDFARNVGRAEDKALGGGTYGFGKGVLYEASICSTILVFTRVHSSNGPESRFMAISLGSTFDIDGKRYTGRHWWGVPDADTGAEPLTGDAAERAAESLGMMRIPPDETGTAIAVIGPVVDEGQEWLQDIVQTVADAATWWAWPHMMAQEGGRPSINFSFSCDGEPVHGTDPHKHPLLQHYVAAFERACAVLQGSSSPTTWPWTVKELRSERPDRRLGALAYRRLPAELVQTASSEIHPRLHSHIALTRNPRLIVKYQEIQSDPHGQLTVGAFIAEPSLDRMFALSEPVAHDDWIPANLHLEKFERNPVKRTMERLRGEFRSEARRIADPDSDTRFTGITRLASSMGDLLQGNLDGTDARINPGSAPGNKTRTANPAAGLGGAAAGGQGQSGAGRQRASAVRLSGEPTLLLTHGQAVAAFGVVVSIHQVRSLRLTAVPRVVLDGGVPEPIGEEPAGADAPTVLGWTTAEGELLTRESELELAEQGEYELRVLVHQPADAAVTVQLHTVESR